MAENRDRADQNILLKHRYGHYCTSATEVGYGNDRWVAFEVGSPSANVLNLNYLFRPDDLSVTATRMGADQPVKNESRQMQAGHCGPP